MDAPESNRSRSSKRDIEEKIDAGDCRDDDDERTDRADKKKHRSGKSCKHHDEDSEEHENRRKRSSGDRNDSRKRAGSGDEDSHDMRRDSRSKIPRKDIEDRVERKSSEGHHDRDLGSSRKGRDDEHELISSRKTSTRPSSAHEGSQSRTRSRAESSHEGELEKSHDKDSRYSDRKENSREKGHAHRDEEVHDPKNDKSSENDKHGNTRDRSLDSKKEHREERRVVDSRDEKDVRSSYMEDGERNRNRSRPEAQDEHSREIAQPREARSEEVKDNRQRKGQEKSGGLVEDAEPNAPARSARSPGEKGESYRQPRGSAYSSRDDMESKESGTEGRRHRRSRTPERSGRHQREMDEHDRGSAEYGNEKSTGIKDKECEDNYRGERSTKGKDSSWGDKNRERESSKDNRKVTQSRRDAKDTDKEFDSVKELDSQKREQEKADSEMFNSRKDSRVRLEGMKASLSYVNNNENSDSVEIKLHHNVNFGKDESVSTFSGRTEVGSQQDFASGASDDEWEDRGKLGYNYGDDLQDEGSPLDQNSSRNSIDSQSAKGRGQTRAMNTSRTVAGQSASNSPQPPFGGNQGSSSFNRGLQGPKGGRPIRGGRRMNGRDVQRVGMPLPMMGPPFGHLGLPSGGPIGPNMPPSPSIGSGVLIPQFSGPIVWPGPRGVDLSMVPLQPNLPSFPPPGPTGPRFAPNMVGNLQNHAMFFNQPGAGRGAPPSTPGPGFTVTGPIGRETPHDKSPMGWGPPRNSGPSGKAPSRGEQNDYSQNFVDTGMRPQNFIRELELTNVVEDYPKLRELIQRKDEIVAKSASPPMYYKCDLREFVLSPEFFGTKFDVILVDPPWEEYVNRAAGAATDHLEYWPFEEILNLKIEAIADTPSFIFLWVGDGVGLELGRQCIKKWGFRRCEDICWVKTNKRNATPGRRHDSRTLFQHSKEHCLMGIKGTVRRSTDGHVIHANIDTDIIIAEEPGDGSTKKPEDMYRIIEHFSLGRRRLELFGEDHNIRSGWLTVGNGLSSSNFNSEAYIRNFADVDGKVWQGGGGRNPPPDASHLVLTTPEIEGLRPKSPPPKNQQQQQQQSMSMMTSGSSNSRRPSENLPVGMSQFGLNQDMSASEPATPAHWASSPMLGGMRGGVEEDKLYEGYSFSVPMAVVGDHHDLDPHRVLSMM